MHAGKRQIPDECRASGSGGQNGNNITRTRKVSGVSTHALEAGPKEPIESTLRSHHMWLDRC